ncbi:MAG: type II toxin-antitoxin system RelE/ParE family toxin, partial [Polyangiales bacterium]
MPTWNLTLKPSFLSEWQALPPKESKAVASKLQDLTTDPTPDGKVKKRLKNLEGKLCRIRAGDYRVFYTFEEPYVSILGVRKRDEHTYAGEPEGENLGGPKSLPDAKEIEKATSAPPPKPSWTEQLDVPKRQMKKTPLREPIGEELLKRLRVPAAFVTKLVGIATEDDLLNCPDVPDDILLRVDQAVTERPFEEIAQQPELVANTVDDLVRYKNGELVGFLLRLDPDQAKFVDWGVKASGPTLLK